MSRIGNLPITLPAKVEINVSGDAIKVKGPKGELTQKLVNGITVKVDGSTLTVERASESKSHRSLHGLYRSLVYNMVVGVSQGFVKQQELVGVGYKASNQGQLLDLVLGYSHHFIFEVPSEIKITTKQEKGQNPTIILESADKQLLGAVAAKIRSLRTPEPYKGKGVKFTGEVLRRKAGKSAAKK
jgi:large subunit ribosomal protein L6